MPKVVDSLDKALEGHHLILATSARSRSLQWPVLDPQEAAKKALSFIKDSDCKQKVAILFGEERIGLENDALACAHYHLIIPTSDEYSSLNLSQAVQVISYICRENAISLFNSNNQDDLNNSEINIEINN